MILNTSGSWISEKLTMSKKRKSKHKSKKSRQENQRPPVFKNTRVQYVFSVLAIALLALLVYQNSLNVPAFFDDTHVFDNPDLRDLGDLPQLLSTWPIPRPVLAFSFAMNYYFGGADTFGYHVVNLLLHIANGILLFFILVNTLRNVRSENKPSAEIGVALAATLIFISHPIQTESVTYIWGRSAVLAGLFYLSAILLFVKAATPNSALVKTKRLGIPKRPLYLVGAALSFFLALGAKVIAISLPAVLLLYDYFFISKADHRRFFRQAATIHSYFLAIALLRALAYLYLPPLRELLAPGSSDPSQWTAVSEVGTFFFSEFFVGASLTFTENILTQSRAFVDYLKLLIFPIRQSADWGYTISRSISELAVVAAMVILLAVLALASVLSRKSGRYKVMAFGILWFFITMALFVVQPVPDVLVERRLYIPAIGFFIFLTVALYHGLGYLTDRFGGLRKYKMIVPVSFAILIGIYSVRSFQRNIVWQDPYTLWQEAALKSPVKTRANNNYGILCLNRGELDAAVTAFQRAISADSTLGLSYTNLLSAYCLVAYDEQTEASVYRAVDLFRELLADKPDHAVDWYIKNYPRLNKPLFNGAVFQVEEQLLQNDSRDGDVYLAVGLLYHELLGDDTRALEHLEKGISLGYSRFGEAYVEGVYQAVQEP